MFLFARYDIHNEMVVSDRYSAQVPPYSGGLGLGRHSAKDSTGNE